MVSHMIRVFSVAVLLLIVCSSSAQEFNSKISKIEDSLLTVMNINKMPGVSIAIYKEHFLWSKGFGYSDLENNIPASPQTSFILASVMKSMTALAVVKLAHDGTIDLNNEIQEYVIRYPKKKWPITIKQVLGHLAGIGCKEFQWEKSTDKITYDTKQVIDIFKDCDLLFEPGTKWEYSSWGYDLLGLLIEEVSGETFEKYMKDNIWKPLNMNNTCLDNNSLIPNRARGYDVVDSEIKNSDYVNNSLWFAAGGGRSTVIDMINFAKGLDQGKILTKDMQQIMYESMTTRDGSMTSYGMGWSLNNQSGFQEVVGMGGQPGTSTMLLRVPNENFAVAIACNLGNKPFELYKVAHFAAVLFLK